MPQNDKKAVRWFRLAAEQGHATASLVDSRGCPLCGNALKGRQRVCSGACRVKLIRLGLDSMALALKGRTREVRLSMMESDGVRRTPDQYWRIHLFECDGV